jgi:hypothetical protein
MDENRFERLDGDPALKQRETKLREIAQLEGDAKDCADPVAAARLQCKAEALRADLTDAHVVERRS